MRLLPFLLILTLCGFTPKPERRPVNKMALPRYCVMLDSVKYRDYDYGILWGEREGREIIRTWWERPCKMYQRVE